MFDLDADTRKFIRVMQGLVSGDGNAIDRMNSAPGSTPLFPDDEMDEMREIAADMRSRGLTAAQVEAEILKNIEDAENADEDEEPDFEEMLWDALYSPYEFAAKAPKAPKAGKKNCTPGKSHFCQKEGGGGTCLPLSKKCGYQPPDGDVTSVSGFVADKAPATKKTRAKKVVEPAPEVKAEPAIAASPSQYTVKTGESSAKSRANKQLDKSLDDWKKQGKKLAAKDPDYNDNFSIATDIWALHQLKPENTRALTDDKGNMQAAASVTLKDKSLHVDYLATAPWNVKGDDPKRTKGAGTAMMEQLIRESKKQGKDGTLTLESLPGATSFYKKLGFEDLGQADGYTDGVRAMRLSPQAAAEFMRKRGVTDFSDAYLDELLVLEEQALGAFCTATKPAEVKLSDRPSPSPAKTDLDTDKE